MPLNDALGLHPYINPLNIGWLAVVNNTDTLNSLLYVFKESTIGYR